MSNTAIVRASLVVATACGVVQGQSTTRVSVNAAGVEGNSDSVGPSMSADGRFVAFYGNATNLVSGSANGAKGVFVHDRQLGTTECASVDSNGTPATPGSANPALSADARFVVFTSTAANLVAGDTNGCKDIFLHDRQTGVTERVSVSSAGLESNGNSSVPSVSADGRFVAFRSPATNLVAGDNNSAADVFVRDRQSGVTERVSVDSSGSESNGDSFYPALSSNGQFVAFFSAASNLVAGDTNGKYDVFVHDRQAGTTELVSASVTGASADGDNFNPAISADGRCVVFLSNAGNLVTPSGFAIQDVFLRDRLTGVTERVSVSLSGAQGNGVSDYLSLTDDGRFVAFCANSSNLVVNDTNGQSDVFVRDRSSGTIVRVSVDSVGVQASSYSSGSSISNDGRFVAFSSYATNLVPNDTNWVSDVFVRDRGVPPPTSYCTSSTSSGGCSASMSANANPSLSLAHTCTITATNVDGSKWGMFFYGVDTSSFSGATPWASGSSSYLCVDAPRHRLPIQNSGGTFGACDGAFAIDWNAYQSSHPLSLGNPWSVGDRVYVQAWFRDPFAVKSTNLSNALEMTYVP